MDDLLHNEDLLIRYLDGELSDIEKADLEQRLGADKSLQGRLTNLRIAIQAVKHLGTTQEVTGIHEQMMQELKPPKKAKVVPLKRIVRYTMAVAASAVVLFLAVKLYTAMQLSPEKLYNEAFVDFNVSGTRSNGNLLSEIEKHYQHKDYGAVITSIRSTHLDEKDSLLIGLSYLHIGRSTQAAAIFKSLAFTAQEFQQDAEFYLSLSYLKNRNYEKAVELMQKIEANPAHLYHEQFSKDFIEDVRSLKK